MDMISKDESPSGISDAIKDALYAKSAERIGNHKDTVANSLFGSQEDQAEVDGVVADASARISGADENGTVEVGTDSEEEGAE